MELNGFNVLKEVRNSRVTKSSLTTELVTRSNLFCLSNSS